MPLGAKKEGEGVQRLTAKCRQEIQKYFVDAPLIEMR